MVKSANTPDFGAVAVCFEDPSINQLFAELLEAHGVCVRILGSVINAENGTRIITEPRYFPLLTEGLRRQCLLVGNKGSLAGYQVQTLSRPLTEEKVEEAIQRFLAPPPPPAAR